MAKNRMFDNFYKKFIITFNFLKEMNDKLDSKSLASAKFKIKNVMNGVHEFVPVVFEDQHFSLVNVVFHSIVLGHF